jgi:hypothetical protein
MAPGKTEEYVAAIYNKCWMVRNYERGGRTSIQRQDRQQAIYQLGLVVRTAFNATEDFEPLLTALFDGLSPKPPPPF